MCTYDKHITWSPDSVFPSQCCFVVEVFYDLNSSAILKSFFFFMCVYIFFLFMKSFVFCRVYIFIVEERLCYSYMQMHPIGINLFNLQTNVHTQRINNIKGINISDFFCYFLCFLFVHNLHPVGSSLLLLFEVTYKTK